MAEASTPILQPVPRPKKRVSIEAYFAAEDKALDKHEYHHGIIRKMAGGSFKHNQLAQRAARLIENFIEENNLNYLVNNSDTKIHIEAYHKVVYPDAVVICEKPIYYAKRRDTIVNPLLVVEVLSPSTEDYNRSTKFEYYRSLSSFQEYVLIHQDQSKVSVYSKQTDQTWVLRDYVEEDTALLFALHNCPIFLKRLYHNIVQE
jgi:Uma2 family endonuclease